MICKDGSFMSIVSGRRPQKSRPHQEGAWIQGTYFSLTKNRVQSSQMIEIEHLLSSKSSNPELACVKGEELNEERED